METKSNINLATEVVLHRVGFKLGIHVATTSTSITRASAYIKFKFD